MRPPRIAGVAGGVGTTVLAAALRAFDDDLYDGGPVEVLVCRTSTTSLGDAHRAVAQALTQAAYPPVLAVVADIPSRARGAALPAPVRARLRMIEPHVSAMVAVPFVWQWRARDDPYSEAAHVLRPNVDLPKGLRDFAAAMAELAGAVEPLLAHAAPPRRELT